MCKSQPIDDKPSLLGAWSGHVTHLKFLGSNHITGTVQPKVVKFRIQLASSYRRTCHPQKGRGYGHVTVVTVTILQFAVMQRVARVCQRQLSYLLFLVFFSPYFSFLCRALD